LKSSSRLVESTFGSWAALVHSSIGRRNGVGPVGSCLGYLFAGTSEEAQTRLRHGVAWLCRVATRSHHTMFRTAPSGATALVPLPSRLR
jgi:hypothetical protein